MARRIVMITGVSCSGKTTLQDEMMKRGWKRPINFTTRQPRDINSLKSIDEEGDLNSKESGEYVFLSIEQFLKKYKNEDFLETTSYLGNKYGVSKYLPDGNVCIILDPVGRNQALEYFTRVGIEVETYYLEINKEEQERRLLKRGGAEEDIISRKRDFNWFSPTNRCKRLNGNKSVKELADFIEKEF